MADINSNAVWSETDSSNTSLSPFPGFPENQNPSCISGRTLVEHPDGTKTPARELFERGQPFDVWAWDGNKKVRATATDAIRKPAEPMVRVYLESGAWFEAAHNHRVLTPKGWRFIRHVLRDGDKLATETGTTGIQRFENIGSEPVYDFTVPVYRNYIMCGVIHHNTVNDAARSLMGAVKRWYNHANATATSGGSANAQTLTYTVAPGSLVTGDAFCFIAGASNSGSTTLNVNALGVVTIKYNGANLVGGEIVSGQIVKVVYDGTNFQLLSKSGGILNPGFSTGSVVFQSATGLAQDNANFFYDGTNHNLGLGGAAASNWRLNIVGHGTTSATYSLVVQNSAAAGLLYVRDDGLVSFPLNYGNGALSVTGTGLFSGTLAVGYGGTGTTTSTGTGSVVLSASPTLTGTTNVSGLIASNGIVSSVAGNQFGTPSGSTASPTRTNTNILLYNNGATNWAGIGADTGGTIYFVTGISAPATRLTIDPSGVSNFDGTVQASGWNITTAGAATFNSTVAVGSTLSSTGWNITAAGAGTFNGNMNIGGAYQISGVTLAQRNGNYFEFFEPAGNGALYLGNATDPTNYYENSFHNFESRAGGVLFAQFYSGGLLMTTGNIVSPNAGNRFGAAAGNATTPTRANTNVLLYDAGATNWAGIGSDTGGNMYFVTGTSSPATHFLIDTVGNASITGTVTCGPIGATGTIVATSTITATGNMACGDSLTFTNHGGIVGWNGADNVLSGANANNTVTLQTSTRTIFLIFNTGNFAAYNGNGSSMSFSSDRALKENIAPIHPSKMKAGASSFVDLVAQLAPVTFNFKSDEDKKEQIGLIAQDVQEIMPHLVTEHEDGTLGLAYGGLVMPLIEAVKELAARVAQLEAK